MRVLKTIERDWRNELRRLIRRKGLVDTGLLWESVEIKAEIDQFGVLEIDVIAMDYIKYLFEPYDLGQFVYKDNLVSLAYRKWIIEKAEQMPMIDWNKGFKPKIIILLNGE